jgi:hypothetical protein
MFFVLRKTPYLVICKLYGVFKHLNSFLFKIIYLLPKVGQLINSNEEITSTTNNKESCLEFNFVYLAHPRAITSISWRQISKFMPR